MKKILLLIFILLLVVVLWYFSIMRSTNVSDMSTIQELLADVNQWFATISLVFALFALCLLVLKVDVLEKRFDRLTEQNQLNLQIIALSTLIQEADATLHRYDRWEAAGIKGDYVNAKSAVREKMNAQRDMLEDKYEQISQRVPS